jgi:hypothetical protein
MDYALIYKLKSRMKGAVTMRNKARQDNSVDYSFAPAITTIAFPLLFGRRKEKTVAQETPKTKPKPKQKRLAVDKYELTEGAVKFFVAKGFPKKKWVILKEMPLKEITGVENSGNDLTVTWNGADYSFVLRKKSESFVSLRDQIQGLLKTQTKSVADTEKANGRKSDLAAAINASIGVVDVSFDVLMGLHEKRVNWVRLEGLVDGLGYGLKVDGLTVAPLNLDFANLSAAVKGQVPKETSKEAYAILKMIYMFFDGLKPDDDQKTDFQNAKDAILAYYTLNDLLFGKVIGDRDGEKESLALEGFLAGLVYESNGKDSFEELKAGLDRFVGQVEDGVVVGDVRSIFRAQLKLL